MPPRVATDGGGAQRQQPQGDERKALAHRRRELQREAADADPARDQQRPGAGARQRQAQQVARGEVGSCDRFAARTPAASAACGRCSPRSARYPPAYRCRRGTGGCRYRTSARARDVAWRHLRHARSAAPASHSSRSAASKITGLPGWGSPSRNRHPRHHHGGITALLERADQRGDVLLVDQAAGRPARRSPRRASATVPAGRCEPMRPGRRPATGCAPA